MKKEIRLGGQTVVCDRDATVALYSDVIKEPTDDDDEINDCLLWKNFAERRQTLYTEEFLSLLSELGADPLKDVGAFIFECEPGELYSSCGGHFVFVGELSEGGAWRPEHQRHSFTFWFTRHFPHNGLPQNLSICAVEFCTEIASVVEEAHRHPRKLASALDNLSEKERRLIGECLQATVKGPFFPDWEFHTIFGLERDDVRRILEDWPAVNELDSCVVLAINNSLNNLLFYPARNKEETWRKFITASPAEVVGIFDKWRGRTPRTSCKRRDYFDDSM